MVARRAEEAPKHTDGLGLGIQAFKMEFLALFPRAPLEKALNRKP